MRIHKLIALESLQRLGWPGACGTLMATLAAAYAAFGLWPALQERQALAMRAVQVRQLLARIEAGEVMPPQAPGQQLADFQRNLPAQLQATETIDRIYATAEREGISLAHGEYSLGVDAKTRLARYRILLPVQGSYPQLRRFLHTLLAEVPALVLEDIDIKRKQIADTQLDGRIRMTLYLTRS